MLNGKNQTTATGAASQVFRNAHLELDEATDEQLSTLELHTANGAGSAVSADSAHLTFVAAAYFAQVPWPKLLHYIVHNVPDTRELPIWRAILTARRLYRLLNAPE